LSYEELVDSVGEPKDAGSFRVYTKTEKVNYLMNSYDSNKDGFLDFYDVKALLTDIGFSNPTKDDVNWIISVIDT